MFDTTLNYEIITTLPYHAATREVAKLRAQKRWAYLEPAPGSSYRDLEGGTFHVIVKSPRIDI